jgi:hypothetical protein
MVRAAILPDDLFDVGLGKNGALSSAASMPHAGVPLGKPPN